MGGRCEHSQKRAEKVERYMYTSPGESLAYFSCILSMGGLVQVGQLPKQGDKLNKSGVLKSMADVLEVQMLMDSSYRCSTNIN